ncbi:hypothetical protein [Acidithiobacillus ferriphilus]|uniref:hypothetical protein n=1 Tax=Acidithiobacillus ferriphilus TaxID=1689834 RepID=UPI001C07067B|nr:hypothetical protein [Acidithiobacillus ferriphilus]MBU2852964.1 hypothetical protein [Acidithiobacillus ferriphilus]
MRQNDQISVLLLFSEHMVLDDLLELWVASHKEEIIELAILTMHNTKSFQKIFL